MYLHNNLDLLRTYIEITHDRTNLARSVIEKDYYVTMILRLIKQKSTDLGDVVFKGGTSLFEASNIVLRDGVKVETALASYSFPTETMQILSFVGETFMLENSVLAKQYFLEPFEMKVQSLERTFIDKVYASCDYYIQKKSRR